MGSDGKEPVLDAADVREKLEEPEPGTFLPDTFMLASVLSFAVFVTGPALGALAMLRLRQLPEAGRMGSENR